MPYFIALVGFIVFSGGASDGISASQVPFDSSEEAQKIAAADLPELHESKGEIGTLTVKLTAYNAVPEQTDGNPLHTSIGAYANPEVVIARSKDLGGDLPYGTVVALTRDGEDSPNCRFSTVEHLIGYRVVADAMHSRKVNQLDVLLDPADTVLVDGKERNPSVALGLCSGVTVEVIGWIDPKDIPETQEELIQVVEGNHFALR